MKWFILIMAVLLTFGQVLNLIDGGMFNSGAIFACGFWYWYFARTL